MMVEDADKSRVPVGNKQPLFPVFPEFDKASYLQRYDLLCQKMMQEQLYSAACLIAAPRSSKDTGEYAELSEMTGLRSFVAELAGHVAAEAARS